MDYNAIKGYYTLKRDKSDFGRNAAGWISGSAIGLGTRFIRGSVGYISRSGRPPVPSLANVPGRATLSLETITK